MSHAMDFGPLQHFIIFALAAFGFPESFQQLVKRMHQRTTARFQVNGVLSDPVQVTSGIRQGCPLAPLLFLIAVETLRYPLLQHPAIRGIRLRSGDDDQEHVISAFVDDTVIFTNSGTMMILADEILQKLAQVSGLKVQPSKSKIICLNRAVSTTSWEDTVFFIPIVRAGTLASRLVSGIQRTSTGRCD